MKTINSIDDIVDLSLNHVGENEYYNCNINLEHNGKKIKAYEVSICNRDLLFFTKKGTFNYVIDSVGFNNYMELVGHDE